MSREFARDLSLAKFPEDVTQIRPRSLSLSLSVGAKLFPQANTALVCCCFSKDIQTEHMARSVRETKSLKTATTKNVEGVLQILFGG